MRILQKIKKYWGKVVTYLKEAYAELKKVQWPTRRETLKYTLIVIGFSVGVAIFLGIIDYILTIVVGRII